ncbi:MAG: PHP domain-containing protein, partial [Bacilli bacterium]|nr:PHP domain-containing protein [Bacilli bacterium]
WSLENYCLADCPFEFVSFADGVLRLRELNENEADEEEHCRIVESFRDLLHFIGYASDVVLGPVGLVTADGPFIPEEEMPQFYADSGDTPYFAAEEPVQEKPVAQPEPAKPVSEEGVEMVFTDEEGQALIIANYEAAIASGESALLEMERANTKRMLEERHRDRVNRRGGYEVLRSLNDVYTMRMGNVDFDGIVFEAEVRTSRKGTVFGRYGIGRGDGAVSVTAFANKANPESLIKSIAKGWHVRVRGAIDLDRYSNQRIIKVHYLEKLSPIELRKDEEEEKRVELHLHTNMSTMDGLPDFSAYYDLARNMGMKAIAVTDHGVVQSFPAAQDARDKHKKAIKENNLDEKELKIIYGSELYMFDMHQQYVHNPAPIPLAGAKYCIFDTETTGLSARYDRIVEFGCVIVEPGKSNVTFDTFVNPEIDLRGHEEAMTLNKISEEQVRNAPTFREIWPKIQECFEGCILVAHNANFDVGFLNAALEREGLPPLSNPIIDTIPISHYLFPNAGRHNEEAMLKNLGLGDVYDASDAHRADYDSIALNEGWQEIVSRLNKTYPGITHADLENLQVELPDLDDVKRENADQSNFDRFLRASNKFMPFWHNLFPKDNIPLRFATYEEAFALLSAVAEPDSPLSEHYASVVSSFNGFCRHLREYHVMVLAKNMQGMKDLNKIVTQGHTTYLASVPKTPRHLIEAYRKNFLVGSACFSSEIFDIASTRNRNVLIEAMGFYDYIEIQPLENYSYLLDMGRIPSKDHLIELLKDIIEAAHAAGKPVVATGDVHYVDPEDKILRDIYIDAKAIGKGSHPLNPPARARRPLFDNPDQHFRSTREMLDSFRAWLPEDEAREYVITNSNRIADQIDENMSPVSKDLFPPNENLPHSDVQLRDLCYGNFHARYDYTFDDDPEVLDAVSQVKSRLDRELEGIIGHGYAVTYFIAHKLIKMANDEPEHYIVGSRGSVGSSFAATMADITEVNPLPPHYQCPHCHYLRFEDPKQYKSGFDLPDAKCPKCGHDLRGNGQHIPFETFLGFAADKVPDIDLNFEDESQHKAHNYTKELLGDRNVFRAGTIETVAEKTAYGFVRGYFEHLFERQGNGKRVDDLNPTYIAYLASRCQGVKRTTGQHPGGIVVVPKNMSVYDFTAVQHPANDLDSEWLTTHYDFSSMHDEILKFDILGHVDPMAMRHYRDLTKVRIEDIPMNDPKVLSLFVSNKELKMHRNYLGTVTGAAALPEFGTDLAQRMLETALPHSFNDLLILSGLSHGTDVWAGNAEDLIKSGTTDI